MDNLEYNWPGVIEFLVKQYKNKEIKENEHNLEIQILKEDNNNLNSEIEALKRINDDLIERIKMLEYSLLKERTKFANLIANSSLQDKKLIMNELIGLHDSKNMINSDVEKYVTNKLEESENKAKEHKDFLKKVLNDLDCKDLLDEFENELNNNKNNILSKKELLNNSSFTKKKSKKEKYNFTSDKKKKKLNISSNSTKFNKQDIEKINSDYIITPHLDSIRKIKFFNNNLLLSVSEDCLIRGLNLDSYYNNKEENYLTIREHCGFLFALETYKEYIFLGGIEGRLNIFSMNDYENNKDYNIEAHNNVIWDICHHQTNDIFGTIGGDKYIKLWQYNSKNNILNLTNEPILEFKENANPSCIKWSLTQHSQLFSGFKSLNKLKIYDIALNKNFKDIKLNSNVNCLENLNDKILAGCDNGDIKLIDPLVNNNTVLDFKHDNKYINTIKLIHNDYYVLSGGEGDLLKLWDIRKNKIIKYLNYSLTKYNEGPTSIETDKHGNVFIGGMDGNINIFEIQNIII